MTETEEVANLQLKLCLLEKDCPGDYPGSLEGSAFSDSEGTRIIAQWHATHCPQCHGTNKVPVLEGVREECPTCGGMPMTGGEPVGCEECEDRGWIPAYRTPADIWKWFEAVGNLGGPGLSIEPFTAKGAMSVVASVFEGELAFFCALGRALGVEDA